MDRLSLLTVSIVLIGCGWSCGGELEAQRAGIDQQFKARLDRLSRRCRQLGLPAQAAQTDAWFVPRDPRRHYLFLVPQNDPHLPSPDAPRLEQQWYQKFRQHRREQAAALFRLARAAVQAADGARAFQLLHEVLREDPDHEAARRVLGFRPTTAGWQRPAQGTRRVRVRSQHPEFGWQRNAYWRVESQHFRITTSHSPDAAKRLAEQLEEFYGLWQQLFFRYWSSPDALAARFAGQTALLGPEGKHRVVLFRDRDEYVAALSRVEPRIGVSLGYYLHRRRTSFFYAGEDSLRPTWLHEVTHQLFQEMPTAIRDVGQRWNFWIVEGVAVYIESLAAHNGYWTVGGFDADRLQYARARTLKGGEYTPLNELVRLGRQELQQDPEIRRLYTQSAGLTHFFMDGSRRQFHQPLIRLLQAVYLGRDSTRSLAVLADTDLDQLDALYRQFLDVRDEDLAYLRSGASLRSLALGRTSITDQGLKQVARCPRLELLDVSFTRVADGGVQALSDLSNLKQLSLERTNITDEALETVSRFRRLEELDLSGTVVTDAGVSKLTRLKNLKTLWVAETGITDQVLADLKELTNLEHLDITGTGISPAAGEDFRRHLERRR